MPVQCGKLFEMLIGRETTKNQLAKQAGISLNIMNCLKREERIVEQTTEKTCISLGCRAGNILAFIPESQQ
ncbi:DNA-binding transcriptional regulator, XRE family [Bittarella massiliensis (ex Durand et al. 2017)]|nr:DNA-binding transcriptional regulator, XRE family [Bittarella massiliensis (ex Durand et al. 2017)]